METEGGGSFLTQKFLGLPAIVWIGGAALVAYFLFSRKGNQPTNSTSGGGGQVHTGKTVVKSGAVRIDVNGTGVDNPQPKPPHNPKGPHTKAITVPSNETLNELAAQRHWSLNEINSISEFTQPKGSTYAGKKLRPDTPLKKGDIIYRLIGNRK